MVEMSIETETATCQVEEVKNNIDNNEEKKSVNGNVQENKISEEELSKKICEQIEYYFGNYNLPRDKFLNEQIKLDDGWVPMEVMIKFKRLADLSTEYNVIFNALKNSELIEIDEEKNKIRRTTKLPIPSYDDNIKAETVKRTVYCKGFPRDGSIKLDSLLEFFKPYGPYETVHMRNFFDKATKKSGFKGSVLVVFPTVEKAQEFMKNDDIQHKKMPILRKWYADYLESKRLEYEERKARKEARLKQAKEESEKEAETMEPLPKGTFLHMGGFTSSTTRDDIKASILEIIDDVAFVDFSKDTKEAYARLSTPDSNKMALEALQGKLKVNDAEIIVRLVEGIEEEEQIKKAELAKSKAWTMVGNKRKNRNGRGGRFKRKRV